MINFDNKMRVELIKTNACDEDVARAAWVSNFGEDARTKDTARIKGLINFLYRNKHMSPFEHGSFTFFVDVPFFVAREFMRHRTFSYNEISGRYTTLQPKFYVPATHRPIHQVGKIGSYTFEKGSHDEILDLQKLNERSYEADWGRYEYLIDSGYANEVSRNHLPLAMYTQFYATTNPRNLMQFLDLRNHKDALFEIRDVAEQMEEYLEDTMPLTYAAYSSERRYKEVFERLRTKYTLEELERLA